MNRTAEKGKICPQLSQDGGARKTDHLHIIGSRFWRNELFKMKEIRYHDYIRKASVKIRLGCP
jgi:hypothetical protein